MEIGPKEMEEGQVVLVARDCTGERVTVDNGRVVSAVKEMMDTIHSRLFDKYIICHSYGIIIY